MSHHVITADNLFDYFHGQVEDARATRSVPLHTDTRLYLATLLADRARTDRPSPPEATLAEMHLHAASATPAEQARKYRELGDHALYVLGYFTESVRRQTVGPSYYSEMGQAAYRRADAVFHRWFSDAFGPVFKELAIKFHDCVGLLSDVKRRTADSDCNPLAVYARWLELGDEADAERLRKLGLLITNPDGET